MVYSYFDSANEILFKQSKKTHCSLYPHSTPPTQTPAVAASQKLNTYLAPDQVLIFEEDSFPCPNWG